MTVDHWKNVTVGVIVFTTVFPFVYTLLVGRYVGVDATISAVLQDAGYRYPIIAAFYGGLFALLLAHWWPIRERR